jgi:hypothetical protein
MLAMRPKKPARFCVYVLAHGNAYKMQGYDSEEIPAHFRGFALTIAAAIRWPERALLIASKVMLI